MCAHVDFPSAVVLGGTRGLGRAIAIELLSRGIQPIVVGRSVEQAKADPALRGVIFVAADLADPTCAETVMAAIRATRQSPSAFYWVAGEYHRGPFAEQSVEKTASMLATHIEGPLAVLGAFHREMKAAKSRYDLIVVGSVFVHKPGKKHAVLAAAKAFKANFARVFSHELSEDLPGSAVLLVNPWAIKTGFFDGYAMDQKAMSGFMDPVEVARITCEQVERLPRDAKPAMVELTLDRGEGGTIKQLVGPQPVKY